MTNFKMIISAIMFIACASVLAPAAEAEPFAPFAARNLLIVPSTLAPPTKTAVAAPAASFIVNTTNTAVVRVNNLALLQSILNAAASIAQLCFCSLGIFGLTRAARKTAKRGQGMVWGFLLIGLGLLLPGAMHWLIASAADANLCG